MKRYLKIQFGFFIMLTIAGVQTASAQCENSGIGTNIPASKLHIKGCTNTAGTSSFQVTDGSTPTPKSLFFIRDDGKIGVGIDQPTAPFQVVAPAIEWPILMQSGNANKYYRNHILIQRSVNGGAVADNTLLGGIAISGYDGANYGSGWNGGAEVSAVASENWTGSARGTSLVFATTKKGTATSAEKMRLNDDGNLGIGVTDPVGHLHISKSNYAVLYLGDNAWSGHHITHEVASGVGPCFNIWAGKFSQGRLRMRIDSAGNVGINTATPKAKFVVSKGYDNAGIEMNPYSTYTQISSYHRGSSAYIPLVLQDSIGNGKVGIRTAFPSSSLAVNGSMAYKVTTLTTQTTYSAGDEMVIVGGTSSLTITLPSAITSQGRIYMIKRTTAAVTVNTSSGQTIDASSSVSLGTNYQRMTIISNGANWYIID